MNNKTKFENTTRFPLTFERLHPGSLFAIFQERSRFMGRNTTDRTVYRKAQEHEGFFAYAMDDKDKVACLMPEDLVSPVKAVK